MKSAYGSDKWGGKARTESSFLIVLGVKKQRGLGFDQVCTGSLLLVLVAAAAACRCVVP